MDRTGESPHRVQAGAAERPKQAAPSQEPPPPFDRSLFDQALDGEWRRAQHDGTPLTLVLLDIDAARHPDGHFCHPAGDEVLRRLTMAMGQFGEHAGSRVARTGGEAFAVLLPNTAMGAGAAVAETLRLAIVNRPMPEGTDQVAASLGVCCLDEKTRFCSPDEFVHAAAEALHAAKRSGRNRIALARCSCDGLHHAAP
jgi:diguanylate cyclase (GGDEF)-like protein